MKRYDTRPKKDGFRMPGEFEPHAGCWMLWPERPDTWRLGGKPAQKAFVEIAAAIRSFEPVTVGVNEDQYLNAVAMLPSDVRVVEMASNDAWMRDCGPTFVRNDDTGEVRGVDWSFNAWGGLAHGRYFPWDLDDQVARKVCDMEYKSRYRLDKFVLEGGAIHADGEGTIITTEESLLGAGRNKDLSKEEITEVLCTYLGADTVIWLKQGIYLDPAGGQVDNICCFAAPGKVVLAWTDDKKDPQQAISAENLGILQEAVDAKGRKLEVVKMPMPARLVVRPEDADGLDVLDGAPTRIAGQQLAASYVGFYIANGGVVVPQYGDPMDEEAIKVVQKCFPDREAKGVDAREVLLGGGSIHGLTQQLPKSGLMPAASPVEEAQDAEQAHV